MTSKDIIRWLDELVRVDSEFLFLSDHKHRSLETAKSSHSDDSDAGSASRKLFASYLVSVITHPIGLKASISPYNASVESMLAYVMDMLNLSEAQLKKMVVKEHLEDLKNGAELHQRDQNHGKQQQQQQRQQHQEQKQNQRQPSIGSLEVCHLWQPELRLRVYPPSVAQQDEGPAKRQTTVRVFLFKEDQHATLASLLDQARGTRSVASGSSGSSSSVFSGWKFIEAFRKSQMSSTLRARPASEVRYELKFVGYDKGRPPESPPYKTIVSRGPKRSNIGDSPANEQQGDIFLALRRHYCAPKSLYILRLEFWLDSARPSGLGYLSRLVRALARSNCFASRECCNTLPEGNRTAESRPDDEMGRQKSNKTLYGFTNVRLDQIPAYAARASYPILDAHEVQVSTCELITDIRNRRLARRGGSSSREASACVLNHLRLYACCIGHQLAMATLTRSALDNCLQQFSVTLDNLLYLPAYAIINQHRLKTNLTHIEDQSLRRSSLLTLLRQLDGLPSGRDAARATLDAYKLLLISVAKHEYSIANRPFDDRNLQEVDPFHEDDISVHTARELVIDIEQSAIKDLVDHFLSEDRLKSWIGAYSVASETYLARSTTLACLRLVRNICDHSQSMHPVLEKLNDQTFLLKEQLNRTISTQVSEKLARKLLLVLEQAALTASRDSQPSSPVSTKKTPKSPELRPQDLWRSLLNEINVIESDIVTHWTGRGLEGLDVDIRKTILNSNPGFKQKLVDLKGILRNKINKLLAN